MFLRHLWIENFRNYRKAQISFSGSFNLFYGDNAQGKTNLLEAIYFLATTKSFKNSGNRDIIQCGERMTRVQGTLETGETPDPGRQGKEIFHTGIERTLDITAMTGQGGSVRKQVKINGSEKSLLDYFSQIKILSLTSEDDAIIIGGPAERRRFLDRAIFNLYPHYLYTVKEYQRLVREKNFLLRKNLNSGQKGQKGQKDLLCTWNMQIAGPGARIVCWRNYLIQQIQKGVEAYYQEISGSSAEISLRYVSSFPIPPDLQKGEDGGDEQGVREVFERALEEVFFKEIALRQTQVGPHRDDLEITISGLQARTHASRGEIKTLILALKLAEFDRITAHFGESPLFLVDDVGRELDAHRLRFLLRALSRQQGQVFLTTPDPGLIPRNSLLAVSAFEVKEGRIKPTEFGSL